MDDVREFLLDFLKGGRRDNVGNTVVEYEDEEGKTRILTLSCSESDIEEFSGFIDRVAESIGEIAEKSEGKPIKDRERAKSVLKGGLFQIWNVFISEIPVVSSDEEVLETAWKKMEAGEALLRSERAILGEYEEYMRGSYRKRVGAGVIPEECLGAASLLYYYLVGGCTAGLANDAKRRLAKSLLVHKYCISMD